MVICWGMIEWNWKGLFHVWETEVKAEKEAKRLIGEMNRKLSEEEEPRLNTEWVNSLEWEVLNWQ